MWVIVNKETKLFFSGFDGLTVEWGAKPVPFVNKLHAQAQASLLIGLGFPAQRKIVQND